MLAIANKAIPTAVGRVVRLVSADSVISRKFVEVAAVRARMGEYAIEHDPYAERVCLCAECSKLILITKDRIDPVIVRRVITVVACGLKNRVEIDRCHTQSGKIAEFLADTVDIPSEEVVWLIIVLSRRGRKAYVLAPAVMDAQESPLFGVILRPFAKILPAAPAKTIRKNLIDNPFAPVLRRFKCTVVNGDLIGARLMGFQPTLAAVRAVILRFAVRGADDKIIPNQTRHIRHWDIAPCAPARDCQVKDGLHAKLVVQS